MQLGSFQFVRPVALAPMAGVTDQPFRVLCQRHGAAFTVAEMISAEPQLVDSVKSRRRHEMCGITRPRIVQIVGSEPLQLAELARRCEGEGADIVDINMGCPAKTVCNKQAGAALLRDESLIGRIIGYVVAAVRVPVTVKMRTGTDPGNRNGVRVAHIAEQAGARMLAVHGRTRACAYRGAVEYETIAAIKARVSIPVLANGDIDSPEQAEMVLRLTGADGVLIGRAAHGNPWLFGRIAARLCGGAPPAPLTRADVVATMVEHVAAIHEFYGDRIGVQIAKKHIGWYLRHLSDGAGWRPLLVQAREAEAQRRMLMHMLYPPSVAA